MNIRLVKKKIKLERREAVQQRSKDIRNSIRLAGDSTKTSISECVSWQKQRQQQLKRPDKALWSRETKQTYGSTGKQDRRDRQTKVSEVSTM